MRALAIAFAAVAWLVPFGDAAACVGLRYDSTGVTPHSMAREMVAGAPTIELMRVVSRNVVDPPDPVFADVFASPPYSFRFEPVQVLKGHERGPLELYGLAPDTRYRYLEAFVPPRRSPLWWVGDEGYASLQETVLLDPADSGTVACVDVLRFEVGATYLVFRDARGALLYPGYLMTGRPARPPQRPVIEVIDDEARDPWLAEVPQVITERGEGPATFWTSLFELIFGYRQRND